MASLVRSVGYPNGSYMPFANKAVHRLTLANNLVAIVTDDNQSGVSGDGGDNTAVPKLYLYLSTDNGLTWTLKATYTTSGIPVGSTTYYSSSIDGANNVHIAMNFGNSNFYLRATYSAGTYTFGTALALALTTNYVGVGLDIDTFGDASSPNVAVVGVLCGKFSSPFGTKVMRWVVTSAGTLVAQPDIVLSSAFAPYQNPQHISICTTKKAPVSNAGAYAVMLPSVYSGASDGGDLLYTSTCNISTGAHTATTASPYRIGNVGVGTGSRRFQMFCDDADCTISVVGFAFNTTLTAMVFVLDPATNVKTDLLAVQHPTVAAKTTYMVQSPASYLAFTKAKNGTNTVHNIFALGVNNFVWNMISLVLAPTSTTKVVSVNGSNVSYPTYTASVRDNGLGWDRPTYGNGAYGVVGGSSRNFSAMTAELLCYYTRNSAYRIDYIDMYTGLPTVTTKPGAGTTQTTAIPALEAKYKLPKSYSQAKWKMHWQFAQDSAFTTNFREFIQADSALLAPLNTDPVSNATVLATDQLPQISSLSPQGTWYIRSREIDEYGEVGAWSPTTTFTLSHAPSATKVAPNNNQVIVYSSGGTPVSWTFTDPYVNDHQTAYEILVTLADGTNTVVADTGKVTSIQQNGTVVIPSQYQDVQLNLQVKLWDADDVSGVYSTAVTFYVSATPTPTVSYPTGTITTGIPTVAWTPGISGTKSESAWHLTISSAGSVIVDTGWVNDSSTSYTVPTNKLHNATSYSLQLQVRDSLGLVGLTTVQFTTNYVLPAPASNVGIYTYEYQRKGFMFIGWDWGARDANFQSWNLYRKAYGESDWTLLGSFPNLTPCYGYRDYGAKANTNYNYYVTQVVNRFGDQVECPILLSYAVKTPSDRFWLLDSWGILDPVPIFNASADQYTPEHEEAVYTVIGAGRHVDTGETLGVNGTITAQMRDISLGLSLGSNWLPNPALQYLDGNGNPIGWTIGTSGTVTGLSYSLDVYSEPSPCAKQLVMRFAMDGIAPAGVIKVTGPNVALIGTDLIVGSKLTPSMWVAQPPSQGNSYTCTYTVTFYQSDGVTVVSSVTNQAMSLTDQYLPAGAGGQGNWKRYTPTASGVTIPAGTVYWAVSYSINETTDQTSNPTYYYLGGLQVSSGATTIPYMDGDMKSAAYYGDPTLTASYSSGFYDARTQRQDIATMRELGRSVYLRNPFGDVWIASLGDIPVTHIAGVGSSEFSDLSIPYREVSS